MPNLVSRLGPHSRRGAFAVLAVSGTLLAAAVIAAPAVGAAPSNDDFSSAASLVGSPASDTGSNVEATKETGEPDHAGDPGGSSVWWSWTAPGTATFKIDACSSDFDTLLGVYTGAAVGSLTEVASNDDTLACGDGTQSQLVFDASSGTTYRIAVDGFAADEGSIGIALAETTSPANDDFASAASLTGTADSDTGTNVDATKETGEPDHAGNPGGSSVWWFWIAPSTATFKIDTCDSDFDTLLGVYTGAAVGSLTEVASNDQTSACGDGNQSRVAFDANSGTTYRIAVDGFIAGEGSIGIALGATTPPVNDHFVDAGALSGSSDTAMGTNVDATLEPGEPDHASSSGTASVWWSWTAPSTGHTEIDTCGSGYDTVLGVYAGPAVSGLTELASNDDTLTGCAGGGTGVESAVSFSATAGTTYRIAVDGFLGDQGPIKLAVSHTPTPAPPTPPTPADTTVDGDSRAKKTQKQGKKPKVVVKVKCQENCTASAGGTVKPKSRAANRSAKSKLKLKPRLKEVAAGTSAKVKLKPKGRKATKTLTKALKQGKKATAKISVTLVDAAGNSVTEKFKVKLKQK